MDLEDLGESLGESRSLEMFPVQGETENFLEERINPVLKMVDVGLLLQQTNMS